MWHKGKQRKHLLVEGLSEMEASIFFLACAKEEKCAPLERWRILEWVAYLLRGGTLYPSPSHKWHLLRVWGEVATHLSHTWLSISPSGAPLFSKWCTLPLLALHSLAINKSILSIVKASWSLGRMLYLYHCNTLCLLE
jgi:hypothetical protein